MRLGADHPKTVLPALIMSGVTPKGSANNHRDPIMIPTTRCAAAASPSKDTTARPVCRHDPPATETAPAWTHVVNGRCHDMPGWDNNVRAKNSSSRGTALLVVVVFMLLSWLSFSCPFTHLEKQSIPRTICHNCSRTTPRW